MLAELSSSIGGGTGIAAPGRFAAGSGCTSGGTLLIDSGSYSGGRRGAARRVGATGGAGGTGNCVVGSGSKVVSGTSTPGPGGGGAWARSFFFCRADRF